MTVSQVDRLISGIQIFGNILVIIALVRDAASKASLFKRIQVLEKAMIHHKHSYEDFQNE